MISAASATPAPGAEVELAAAQDALGRELRALRATLEARIRTVVDQAERRERRRGLLIIGLSVLAIFGLHPGRAGFTAVEVVGPRPSHLERADGSPLFSGTLPGAERAGLASVVGAEELLELAWRLWPLA